VIFPDIHYDLSAVLRVLLMKLWRYGLALERLGQRYRLDGVLGSGGMADVCLAWDEHEGRNVAIKVIKPHELDQVSLDRFLKEASQVARWRHPNILRVYGDVRLELLDVAQGSVVPYIVMEYAQNGDLHKRLRPGMPYAFAETLIVFEQLCHAVAYAHAHGIIHRDLKPLNVLFRALPSWQEQAVLSDFGLAVEKDASHFTYAAGGTLPYMAPEQLRGQVSPASDIFALGVILYQLCTGRLPFRRSIADLRQKNPSPTPPLPSEVYQLLPPALDDVIMQALDADPRRRYPNALEFWDAVHAVTSTSTIAEIARHEALGQTSLPASPTWEPPSESRPRETKVLSAIERSRSAPSYDVASRRSNRQTSGSMAQLDSHQSDANNNIQASNYPITQPRASIAANTGPHTKVPRR
jgi:serine/threonine protein kinase